MKLIANHETIDEIYNIYASREMFIASLYYSDECPFRTYYKAAYRFLEDQRTMKWETIHDVIREEIEAWNEMEDFSINFAADLFAENDPMREGCTRQETLEIIADRVIRSIVHELEHLIGTLSVIDSPNIFDILNIGGEITLYGLCIHYPSDVEKLKEAANVRN